MKRKTPTARRGRGSADQLGGDRESLTPPFAQPQPWPAQLGLGSEARESFDGRLAGDAWGCHRALVLAEIADPQLRNNPRWSLLRWDALEEFCAELAKPLGSPGATRAA